MWARYRDGFGLPITIISIIVILFDQGYVRTSVLALIVGVYIYLLITSEDFFLTSRERQEQEEQRRIRQIEYERFRKEKEEIFNLHEQWASPVRKKLENDPLWREAVYRTHTHSKYQKLTEDQIYKRVRELLPQFVVDAPEHWSEERIVVPPQIFFNSLGSSSVLSVDASTVVRLELWGYDRGAADEFQCIDTFHDWDSGPSHPFSLDEAMYKFSRDRYGNLGPASTSRAYMHLYPHFENRCPLTPHFFVKKDTLDRLSSEFPAPAPAPRHHHKRRRTIPRDVQDRVWRRDSGKCGKCGSNENLEFDHIIPFSKGGASTYRNLQLLCQKCNRSKSDKIGG